MPVPNTCTCLSRLSCSSHSVTTFLNLAVRRQDAHVYADVCARYVFQQSVGTCPYTCYHKKYHKSSTDSWTLPFQLPKKIKKAFSKYTYQNSNFPLGFPSQ